MNDTEYNERLAIALSKSSPEQIAAHFLTQQIADDYRDYHAFLASKSLSTESHGFEPQEYLTPLFDFQKDIVRLACKVGRFCVWADCGLGKSIVFLEWAHQVCEHTGKRILILAPLAVSHQIVKEAEKFGVPGVVYASRGGNTNARIVVTNYQKLQHFNPNDYIGIVCDESSVLKSMDGKTRTAIIEAFARTPYRLAASATPAPNDQMELGNHAEFLGIMSRVEMLSMFFVHDGGDTSKWRLKGHAQDKFWEWVCTWAVTLRKPSDLGYEDGKFLLPPLNMHHHTVESTEVPEGMLFVTEAQTLSDRRNVRRSSMTERIAETVKVVRSNNEQWLIWCDLNAEQDALERVFGDDCVSIRGATPDDDRVPMLDLWLSGKRRVLVSKPSVFGFGLNLQVCHNIAFVGLSDSWEQYYQAIRRCWRFGQTHSVECHIIASSAEGAVTSNILRKEKESTARIEAMVEIMRAKTMEQLKQVSRQAADYDPQIEMKLPRWLHA